MKVLNTPRRWSRQARGKRCPPPFVGAAGDEGNEAWKGHHLTVGEQTATDTQPHLPVSPHPGVSALGSACVVGGKDLVTLAT